MHREGRATIDWSRDRGVTTNLLADARALRHATIDVRQVRRFPLNDLCNGPFPPPRRPLILRFKRILLQSVTPRHAELLAALKRSPLETEQRHVTFGTEANRRFHQ